MKIVFAFLLLLSCSVFGQTPPNAQFTVNQNAVCLGAAIQLNNQSTNGSAAITSCAWDFGDGNAATTTNASHVYSAPGTYTITLVVQAANGQADAEVKVNYITIHALPIANFTTSANGCALPVGINFTNTSLNATSYSWDFGNTQTSNLQVPTTINYTSAGVYSVQLIALTPYGCVDTIVKPISISNFQAVINAPLSVCQNEVVNVSDNSTTGVTNWSWLFTGGNALNTNTANPSITYPNAGSYSIVLTAINTTSGCTATTSQQIIVLPTPTPSFTASPVTGCAPLQVTFNNTSVGSGTFSWDFGDNTFFNGQTPPTHTYFGNGTYTTTLYMTGQNGCSDSIALPAVTLTSPVANFTSNVVNGCSPLSVQFTDQSTSVNPIVSWAWDFGDGTTFNGQNPPLHSFGVGVYSVRLIITTQSGCVDTLLFSNMIEVGSIDLVNFNISPAATCAKSDVNFTNLSVISAPHFPNEITYSWNFGDGGTSTLANPTYKYLSDTGYFDVSLVVAFRGCLDTLTQTNAVYIKAPISFFSPNDSLFCNPTSFPIVVQFDDDSKIGKLSDDCSMIWKWGDGTTTNFDDPDFDDLNLGSTSHSYSTYGSYTITQIIYNYTTGCSDSTNKTIVISSISASIAPLLTDSVCVGTLFAVAQNSNSTDPFSSFVWDMGDGNTIAGANPSYFYATSGTYTIKLTATNVVGCADDVTFSPFTALANPVANLIPTDNAGCVPLAVQFTNGSSVINNGAPLYSFIINFSDTNESDTSYSVNTSFNHTFQFAGSFPISLIVTDEFGCVSNPAISSINATDPIANFIADSVVCNHEAVPVLNGSIGFNPMSYQWIIDGSQQATGINYSPIFHDVPTSGQTFQHHTVLLIAIDGNGCKDSLSQQVIVSLPYIDLDFQLSGAATNANGDYLCPPVFATFSNNSNSYGAISSYQWSFGDGKSSTIENPSNTYVFPGTYDVALSITDEFGCQTDSVLSDFLTVFGPTANPSWTITDSICGQEVLFDLGANTGITAVLWHLGDGTTVNDSLLFSHTYIAVDTYQPLVSIWDQNQCQIDYSLNPLTIAPNGVNALFSASDLSVEMGELVTFNDQSTAQNPIVSWTWEMENSSSIFFTNSPYATAFFNGGEAIITLIITDSLGCTDSYELSISVNGDFQLPNVITTDNDGINDVFSYQYDIFKSFDIVIVNRWGNTISQKSSETGTIFWDGKTNKGEPVVDGVYFYVFEGTLFNGTKLKKDGFIQVVNNK
ncbi:MAG: PKD domain-containing protein [Moraxellaceae bacterium]